MAALTWEDFSKWRAMGSPKNPDGSPDYSMLGSVWYDKQEQAQGYHSPNNDTHATHDSWKQSDIVKNQGPTVPIAQQTQHDPPKSKSKNKKPKGNNGGNSNNWYKGIHVDSNYSDYKNYDPDLAREALGSGKAWNASDQERYENLVKAKEKAAARTETSGSSGSSGSSGGSSSSGSGVSGSQVDEIMSAVNAQGESFQGALDQVYGALNEANQSNDDFEANRAKERAEDKKERQLDRAYSVMRKPTDWSQYASNAGVGSQGYKDWRNWG